MTRKPEMKCPQLGRCGQRGGLPWEGLLSPPGPPPQRLAECGRGGGACMPRLRQVAYTNHQTEGPAWGVVAQSLWRPWVGGAQGCAEELGEPWEAPGQDWKPRRSGLG